MSSLGGDSKEYEKILVGYPSPRPLQWYMALSLTPKERGAIRVRSVAVQVRF